MENEYILVSRLGSALYQITSISHENNATSVRIGKTWVTARLIEIYDQQPVRSGLVNRIRQEWNLPISIRLASGDVVFGDNFERLNSRYT